MGKKAATVRNVEKLLGSTVIKSCTCSHPFQDRRYGKRKRVHNVQRDKNNCTVCGN